MTHWHKVRRRFRLFASCAVYVEPPNYKAGELAPMSNSSPGFKEWSR
jgi:hypothetical protein